MRQSVRTAAASQGQSPTQQLPHMKEMAAMSGKREHLPHLANCQEEDPIAKGDFAEVAAAQASGQTKCHAPSCTAGLEV